MFSKIIIGFYLVKIMIYTSFIKIPDFSDSGFYNHLVISFLK